MKNLTFRSEERSDFRKVENLTREAFWNVYRPGCLEHYVLHVLRSCADFVPELSIVMERDGEIIGHVAFVRAHIKADNGCDIPVLTFGPFSIGPEFQCRGYGKILLEVALSEAKRFGAKAVCIEGDIGFYGKCGFVTGKSKNISYHAEPDGDAPYFLVCELEKGYLDNVSGVYYTPQVYFVDETLCEEFDKSFPKKDKKSN